jgi:hypothetical protein
VSPSPHKQIGLIGGPHRSEMESILFNLCLFLFQKPKKSNNFYPKTRSGFGKFCYMVVLC